MTDEIFNNWYKPLEQSKDEKTIKSVYITLSLKKKYLLNILLDHASKRKLFNASINDINLFDSFTENEKLMTYYLINEAILYKDNLKGILEIWETT